MKSETTPKIITPKIKEYYKDISEAIPVYVYVHPASGMKCNNCFPNVSSLLEQIGGRQVNGWLSGNLQMCIYTLKLTLYGKTI